MENAVKALLIVAGVLIGVLILSMTVALYSSLSGYAEEVTLGMEQNELNRFNEQFTKYIRNDLTIHDVVTAASIAYENNLDYNLDITSANENTYYVQVWLKDGKGERRIEDVINLETNQLLEDNLTSTFKCISSNIQFSSVTGRIMSIKFEKN